MPLKAYYFTPDGKLQCNLDRAQIIEGFRSKQGLLWVDIAEITYQDSIFLEDNLGFHHLAVEDCLSTQLHSPKIDNFNDYLFIIAHGINYVMESDVVETAELAVFLGKSYVVSVHRVPLYSVRAIQSNVEENPYLMKTSADFLAHAILDALVDNVMPAIDSMSEVAEAIEEEVVRQPQQGTLEGILKLKRSALRVHRVMSPQRDVFNRLSRGEFPLIKDESRIFYRDVYDHVVRIEDLNQSIIDQSDNALATYLSSVANRQNETMRVLSIVATMFLPLTLLAGIYGMNFDYMPELHWRWGYFAVLGVIALVILVLIWRFWASGWFAWGRRKMSWVKPFRVEGRKIRGHLNFGKKDHDEQQITPDTERI
jgi:magnesium transporter